MEKNPEINADEKILKTIEKNIENLDELYNLGSDIDDIYASYHAMKNSNTITLKWFFLREISDWIDQSKNIVDRAIDRVASKVHTKEQRDKYFYDH